MLERARELLPVPELQQPEQEPVSYTHLDVYKRQEQEQDRGHTWGGMEL